MNGKAAIRAFITLLVVAIIGAILFYLVGYLAATWNFFPLITKALYTILVVAGAIIVIDALLGIVDKSFINWS